MSTTSPPLDTRTMPSPARAAVIDRLRQTIDGIEKRAAPEPTDTPSIAQPFAALDPDALHEIWVPGFREAAAGLAFALGHAAARLSPARPAILWIQMAHEGQETGLPYAPALSGFGLDPARMVLIRTRSVTEMLWATEEAAGCTALAGIVLDVLATPRALDFTASRRLALRSGASGVPVLALRYGSGREASAARTRWRIMPAPSRPHPYDVIAPGSPTWHADLEKSPAGRAASWHIAWTGAGFAALPDLFTHNRPPHALPLIRPASRTPADAFPDTAAPGPHRPALGDRLREAG